MKTATGNFTSAPAQMTDRADEMITLAAASFRFSVEEKSKFSTLKTARLIAALPFLAECEDAERTALAHLSMYILAARDGRAIFDHKPSDDADLFSRLRLGMSFKGGNQSVLKRGMDLLALQMLSGYNRDRSKDAASGEYNPLNSGSWDFNALSGKLQTELQINLHPSMDAYMSMAGALGIYWQ